MNKVILTTSAFIIQFGLLLGLGFALIASLSACGRVGETPTFRVIKCQNIDLSVDKDWKIVSGLDTATRACNTYIDPNDPTATVVNVPFHGVYLNAVHPTCGFIVVDNGLVTLDDHEASLTNSAFVTWFPCQ